MRAHPVRVDEVLGRPAVQVVLGLARLGELLPALVLARRERAEQGVAPDLLVAARVVDLVELVAPAELAADRVPQELHQLDAAHRVYPARTTQVEAEILRSEERRVGKECRTRWAPDREKRKT